MSTEPEALRLANELEALEKSALTSLWARDGDKKVVAELRRLHEQRSADLEAMRMAVEAMEWAIEQAGGPECEHEASVCFCKENAALTALRVRVGE